MNDGLDPPEDERLRERLGDEEFHNLYRHTWRRRHIRRGPLGELLQRLVTRRGAAVILGILALVVAGRYWIDFSTAPAPLYGTVAVTATGSGYAFSGVFRSADGKTTEAVADAHATSPVSIGDAVPVWYLGAGKATTVDPGGGSDSGVLPVVFIILVAMAVVGIAALLFWLRRAASSAP
ncbi:hypothetical protein [Hamadaea tsunoensis]|uniref:hypothetical protein n=1 Tax=Hamadaea tsunoensis TaxID=53368 RepID=UPI00047F0C14|nr:hypothetical protein [Hamadaea tsunoensis]